MWLSSDECKKVVETAWHEGVGEPVVNRIEAVANDLSTWADDKFGSIKKQIKLKERALERCQRSYADAQMIESCKTIATDLDTLHKMEDSFWYMRARATALRDGD